MSISLVDTVSKKSGCDITNDLGFMVFISAEKNWKLLSSGLWLLLFRTVDATAPEVYRYCMYHNPLLVRKQSFQDFLTLPGTSPAGS
jgi:hypothetical protein